MTQERLTVSVVIPTYRTREVTLRCVESLLRSRPDEILVVDDAGADGTVEAIAKLSPAVRTMRNEVNAGFTVTANRGLSAASGDVLLLLNSDTEVQPDFIDAVRAEFGRDNTLGAGGARLIYPDGSPQWSGGKVPGLAWMFVLTSGVANLLRRLRVYDSSFRPGPREETVEWVSGAAMAIRRECWDRIGPLDTRFVFYSQDLDFCVRARQAGFSIRILDAPAVVHIHGETIAPENRAIRANLGLLWSDLVRWADKHRGRGWARRAALLMMLGGWIRLAGTIGSKGWNAPETAACRGALAALGVAARGVGR